MLDSANERGEAMEINIVKLLGEYLRYWWMIVLAAIVVAAGALYYTIEYITPLYRTSVTIYVNSYRTDYQVETATTAGLSTAESLVTSYMTIAKSKNVLSEVSNYLKDNYQLDFSVNQLSSMITTSQVTSTSVFYIYVSNSSPKLCATIANAMGDVVPGAISNIVEGSSAFVLDYADAPTSPYYPNRTRNTVLGAVAGAIAVAIFLTLRFLFDVRIWEADDLALISVEKTGAELPVLAQIPEFETEGTQKYDNGYAGSYAHSGYSSYDSKEMA